ncbi:MAG: hypothetical protein LQ347_005354 [Umbilicaria vellea]|nr:MAG: hypothetical protein LQ347_005354 [Umbilicaria vellea]
MRAFNLYLITTLIQASNFVLAIPHARSEIISSHFPRVDVDNVSFRVRTTAIVLTATLSQVVFKAPITDMLFAAYNTVQAIQMQNGLGLVRGGEFVHEGADAVLKMWNANNHQLTWDVVGVVVMGLLDFTLQQHHGAAIVFKVYNGANQVGAGQISMTSG